MRQAVKAILTGLFIGACSCGASIGSPTTIVKSTELKALAVGLLEVYFVENHGAKASLKQTSKESPEEVVPLASVDGAVSAMALDDRYVYLVARKADLQGSSIVRVSKPQRAKPPQQKEIIRSSGEITSLALDAVQLYFTQSGNNSDPDDAASSGVMRTMSFGGTPFPVVAKQPGTPVNLLLSATHVLWINAEYGKQFSIMAFRKTGGQPVVLYRLAASETGNVAPAMATDDNSVFLKTRSLIIKVSIDGRIPDSLAQVQDSDVSPVAMDARNFYFLQGDQVLRFGIHTRITEKFSVLPGIRAIALDDRFLYALSPEGLSCSRKR